MNTCDDLVRIYGPLAPCGIGALSRMAPGCEKVALALAIFGRKGTDVLAILEAHGLPNEWEKTMKPSDRIMLHDYVQSRERVNPPRIDEESLVVKYTKGAICISLIMLMLWLIWKMTTPNGIAFFQSLLN